MPTMIHRTTFALDEATAQRLKRMLLGHASDCDLDGSGRVLLPGRVYHDEAIVVLTQRQDG